METCPICNNNFAFEVLVDHTNQCQKEEIAKRRKEITNKFDWTDEELNLLVPPESYTGCSNPSQIFDDLWLGGSAAANDKAFLESEKIVRVLNVADGKKCNELNK